MSEDKLREDVARALCLSFYGTAWADTSQFRQGICEEMAADGVAALGIPLVTLAGLRSGELVAVPTKEPDWKRVARALLDTANAAQDGDGYQVAAEVRATWKHYTEADNAREP